jgi:hypothetical protein
MKSANVLPELQWFDKKRKLGRISDTPVSITVTTQAKNSREDRRRLAFAFRDKLYQNFKSNYITFAILKNRMYFKSVQPKEGYAVTVKGLCGYVQVTITLDELKDFEPFV